MGLIWHNSGHENYIQNNTFISRISSANITTETAKHHAKTCRRNRAFKTEKLQANGRNVREIHTRERTSPRGKRINEPHSPFFQREHFLGVFIASDLP